MPSWTDRNVATRDRVLAELADVLKKRGQVPLCGIGGAGKTKLAVEYAHRNRALYDIVFLISAENVGTLAADIMTLAGDLGTTERDPTSSDTGTFTKLSRTQLPPEVIRTISAVKNKLARRDRWLLIFDDVRDPQDVEMFVPQTGQGGHVIHTSRNAIWRGFPTVTVRGLERDESVRFLLRRTGETDAEAADELAEEFGDLPLALAQAGAYIEETGRPLAEYLALFRHRPFALLERPIGFPVTVATTWDRSLAEAFASQPAKELLSLCSVLPLDDIPRRMLGHHDPLALDDAIAKLRQHSLLEMQKQMLNLHRLVKVVVRNQLSREDRRRWRQVAHRIVENSGLFPAIRDDEAADDR